MPVILLPILRFGSFVVVLLARLQSVLLPLDGRSNIANCRRLPLNPAVNLLPSPPPSARSVLPTPLSSLQRRSLSPSAPLSSSWSLNEAFSRRLMSTLLTVCVPPASVPLTLNPSTANDIFGLCLTGIFLPAITAGYV